MIGIVDYGLGNVRAFANIYTQLNVPFIVATGAPELDRVSRVILPGVGAFDQAMQRLKESGMKQPLAERVEAGMPVLGVCVGMQILMASSEEGTLPGLGWIEGDVVRFTQPPGSRLSVPHMGWNTVTPERPSSLFEGMESDAAFYFLHSYYTRAVKAEDVLATTDYGSRFACAVQRGNVHGVQFHPEKSHGAGIRLLRNFAGL